jgi:hypothetical protein
MKLNNITKYILYKNKKYEKLFFFNKLHNNLFCSILTEDIDNKERSDVLNKINNNDWEKPQNPESFLKSLSLSRHPKMLSPYSIQELSQMKLYKLNGYNIGFALKKKDGGYKEIIAVHNNESDIKNIGRDLMKAAIKKGGRYLDHFDGHLSSFYESLGFVEYARDKFDTQYDKDNSFRNQYGESDIIYRKYKLK